ncbi:MAG: phosphoribosylglycinamide formyltransferase [candidate division WOR-3 bacterium]|nr:MAG: phosphoribosylglycinamide formyltransferase [candidate division WOR-3 bacterium]
MSKVGVGVLASGRGSNFEALVRATRKDIPDAEVRVLVCNVPDALALRRAEADDIPHLVVNHKKFDSRKAFEEEVVKELNRHDVRLVCLAGFMRILSPYFVHHYESRIMNIHPSLLPAFAGLQGMQVHRAVLESGAKITGCTVHFVTDDVDAGPIVVQRAIQVREDDTPDSLAVRVLLEEHQAYARAVKLYAENRLQVEGRRVRVLGE